ncbi:MAG: acyl-CoA dehydrogenase, putative phosphotransferase [uncultured Thermomicrobiales bacterium]|uniref:Acyl-CoA dehydrogenase, putative phosphotransferase n=1 Tax=uncultured Thermomicrobiales bacterium TaxID=1645740 RepID=A0A6J4UYZ8_9BACT|nr:MAG: acyl-CoA dehydrogenase, putative phosphotransferase [uncultured Thermomicrobiales bacterium]
MGAGATDGTIAVREGEDFDRARVLDFLRARLGDLPDGPLAVRQFPSGASNLTYLLQSGDWEAVLRRPPLGPLPPKAHDMVREARLLERLHAVYPLAPNPRAICDDPAIIGAPFYVMERRRGVVLDDRFPPGFDPTPARCRRISESVVAALAQFHAIDWRAAGLAALGYPDGFLARQVRGWIGRYDAARTPDAPEIAPLAEWLTARLPTSPAPTIIHNDFKLNNLLLAPGDLAPVVAVLDWEMTTIGDPLFDLGVSLSYWVESADPPGLRAILPTVTDTPGFYSRREFMARYAALSGRDLGAIDYYLTLAYFKLATILQQIYARWQRGQTRDERFGTFGPGVRALIAHATGRAENSRES